MPTSAKRAPATRDDLARLRDAGRAVELIAGEIVEKAAPTPAHGRAEIRFGQELGGYNRRSGGQNGPGGCWLMTEVEVLYEKSHEVFRHNVLGFRRDRHEECPSEMPLARVPRLGV